MPGVSSQGLKISRETSAGSGSYTDVANITGHNGPNSENPEVDVTALSSTAKEFLPGLKDNGDLSVDLNFDPGNTTHQQISADQEASPPTVSNWRISFPTDPVITWTFPAFVKSFSVNSGVDAPLKGSLTLRIAGDITRA